MKNVDLKAKKIVEKLLTEISASPDDSKPGKMDLSAAMEEAEIMSSSAVSYATQEEAWDKVSKSTGMAFDEIAAEIATGNYDTRGIEGLYALTGNEELFKLTDYANVEDFDQLAVSYMYGGPRLEQFLKYVPEEVLTPKSILKQLKQSYDDFGTVGGQEFSEVRFTSNSITINEGGLTNKAAERSMQSLRQFFGNIVKHSGGSFKESDDDFEITYSIGLTKQLGNRLR